MTVLGGGKVTFPQQRLGIDGHAKLSGRNDGRSSGRDSGDGSVRYYGCHIVEKLTQNIEQCKKMKEKCSKLIYATI